MKIFKKNLSADRQDSKGFTLIELLVVIAIIGMLSSVVLVSLNSARGKGADVAIKANLSGVRTQAEVYYDTNGSYGTAVTLGACPTTASTLFGDDVIENQIAQAKTINGGGYTACASIAGASGSWAVAANLKSDATKAFCVDSRGVAKEYTGTAIAAITVSATTNASCT